MPGSSVDVAIVGGGPAGSSAAFWLARSGFEVALLEKKEYPREKTCGDGLTPRAIKELIDLGFDFEVPEFHRIVGLRAYCGPDLKLEMPWPDHSIYPNWGGVIRRADLDAQVAALVEKEGAVVHQKTEAVPLMEGERLSGVQLRNGTSTERLHARAVVIADGSLSRFGRSLGTSRRRDYPMGLAARGYFSSELSGDQYMESQLDMRDETGASMPGYGWVFPLGDGTVNVGVGVLSTFKRWKAVNTSEMMDRYVRSAPEYWGLSEETALTKPRGGKLSMALSVGPRVGPNWLAVGDAVGAINPWNGEGIAYAYETGRLAAEVIEQALGRGDLSLFRRYDEALDARYSDYYKMARIFVKAIGRPAVMRSLAHTGLRSRPLMEWVLRVMANLLEPEERELGSRAYTMLESLVRRVPAGLA